VSSRRGDSSDDACRGDHIPFRNRRGCHSKGESPWDGSIAVPQSRYPRDRLRPEWGALGVRRSAPLWFAPHTVRAAIPAWSRAPGTPAASGNGKRRKARALQSGPRGPQSGRGSMLLPPCRSGGPTHQAATLCEYRAMHDPDPGTGDLPHLAGCWTRSEPTTACSPPRVSRDSRGPTERGRRARRFLPCRRRPSSPPGNCRRS